MPGSQDWWPGRVLPGHGVASGRSGAGPYPAGTIELQRPHFLRAGLDLSPYFPGTLNVDLAPLEPVPSDPVFDQRLRWFQDLEERFILSRVALRSAAGEFEGLWYYPDPATKPAHFQKRTVVELLLPRIEGLGPGAAVAVSFRPAAA